MSSQLLGQIGKHSSRLGDLASGLGDLDGHAPGDWRERLERQTAELQRPLGNPVSQTSVNAGAVELF
ncbi:hypothetical protein D9M68_836660 [compost metagenome]